MPVVETSANVYVRPEENENAGFATEDCSLESAVLEAGEQPSRASTLAADLGIERILAVSVAADHGCPASHEPLPVPTNKSVSGEHVPASSSSDDETAAGSEEDDEDDPNWDEWQLRNLHNTRMEARILDFDAPGENFLKSLVLAFCSNADLDEGESADISPQPGRADRTSKNLIFSVNTEGFAACPTRTGWTFQKGDDLEIWQVDRSYDYTENEVVVVVAGSCLTLCELRETTDKDQDGDNLLRLFNLRTGAFLPSNAVLIIGSLWSTQRKYKGPIRPFDRALDRVVAESNEARRRSKTDDQRSGVRTAGLLECYMAEEEKLNACGNEHEGFHCTLSKGHDGDHCAELDGEGADQRWPAGAAGASEGGAR